MLFSSLLGIVVVCAAKQRFIADDGVPVTQAADSTDRKMQQVFLSNIL